MRQSPPKTKHMEKCKADKLFGKLMLGISTACFLAVLFFSFSAVKTLGENYAEMKQADLSQVYRGTISYDDGLYAVVGYGIETDPADPASPQILADYLEESLSAIDGRILSAGIVYTMIISSLAAFYHYQKHRDNHSRRIRSILLGSVLVYVLYIAAIVLMHAMNRIPLRLPEPGSLPVLGVSLLSVLGGLCALDVLIRIIPLKKITSLLVLPLVFVLFLFSAAFEGQLYVPACTESFAYLAEIDSRILEEGFDGYYYDEAKNVIVLEGTEYPPELVPNPEYLAGSDRIKAYVYEALDPFSGSALSLMEDVPDYRVPGTHLAGYALKALLWIILAGRRKQ